MAVSYRVIGQPVPRADGREKVTGAAHYTADVPLPGTLWGVALRSPLPHARITRIDVSQAHRVSGVQAVLTGADVRGILYGRRIRDVPVLAQDRVRFTGERVAAVAAVDADTAQHALDLIDVEYEELPALFDPLEAIKEGAPLLHPDVNSYAGLPQPLERPSNAFVRNAWSKGDVAQGFAQAELIVEDAYTTPLAHQAYLEPHTCLVWIDGEDRVQVWASNKTPYSLRQQLSEAVGIPLERVRMNHVHIGGDFGGKGSPMDVPLCYFLALRSGRPVRMVMDYAAEFMAANPRHPSTVRLKTGVMRDGTLVAHQVHVIYNSGAYGGFKPRAHLGGARKAAGPYKIPHVHIESVEVYTNTVPGGHMRAPGEPQAVFAVESHMDGIARRLSMDPLEFRLKNVIEEGDDTPIGDRYQGVRARETLAAAVKAAHYKTPKPLYVGRGLSMGDRTPGGGDTHAAVTLNLDGSVVLNTPVFEQGSGTYTILEQIVAEELGLPAERVRVEVWDTDAVPFDSGVGGSRMARIQCATAHQATQEARQEMVRLAAELLGWPEERTILTGDEVSHQDTGEREPWAGLLARADRSVTGRASLQETTPSHVTSFTAQVAEVAVDPETGQVQLLRFTTAHDVGTVLNPLGHQGQIDGGVVQGVGYALMEELRAEEGRITSTSFGEYKVPNIRDVPELNTVLLEPEGGVGPYDIKGIGENPISPVAPAIANAVEDAVGVRIRDLPITAEKVYRALRQAGRALHP